jgi:hypothetical protein
VAVDAHQRAMWHRMLDEVSHYRIGEVSLARLVDDLRGLFVEADPHDPAIYSDFQTLWACIEGENELRTEPWAPPGSASDANLDRSLSEFVGWVEKVLAGDATEDHA